MSGTGGDDAFEALSDCAACRVESSVVELIAARGGAGVVLESKCRLCLREQREGALVFAGERFAGDEAAARAALARWARSEGDDDVERFVQAHFAVVGPGVDAVGAIAARLARGEPVETSFDAIAWLFPGVGAIGGGGAPPARPEDDDARATTPFVRPAPQESAPPVRRSVPPIIPTTHESIPLHKQPLRVSARALCAVMLADGQASPADRAFLDATLRAWGHPPLRDDDLAVWRPHDLGWPHDPRAVVDAMARLAFVDGERDTTEWRVAREFARAWGVPLEVLEALGLELEREHERGLRRVVSSLTRLFVR
ncbi:hypothetical protein [Sandaracinus amylolyticus]|uniref:Uncharacterized protein n=1 Tax=Sandaracinus amylolyticus TaxID=927083 RepID=A0A0F6SDV4_9BACT|nr:hypothetical protein [Sandaracinus amylolyticus]AKF04099.1 hypothetical protein DB32_001248 [Sandaracinus amylolyticus]